MHINFLCLLMLYNNKIVNSGLLDFVTKIWAGNVFYCSNLLAKSLPANLPSYYCSNDLSHKSGDFLQAHNTNSFSDSRKTLKTTSNQYNYGYNSTSTSFEESFKNHEDKQVQKSCVQIICPLFVAVLSIIAAMYYYGLLNQETSSNYDKSKFNKDMSDLGEKYKINEDSILEVQSGK